VIARVLPLTRTRAIRGLFDYRLPDGAEAVEVGSLLSVPFGRRMAVGVVVELAQASELPDERLAEPCSTLPVRMPRDLVELAGWMAGEYCSTPARALSAMLPPGAGQGRGEQLLLVAELTPAGRGAVAGRGGPEGGGVALNERQAALLAALAAAGETVAAELGTPALRRLEARGLVAIRRARVARAPAGRRLGFAPAEAPPLGSDQRTALAAVVAALDGPAPRPPFLLHGVTGSGKTEVYLGAVRAALDRGRTAIVLVPEIAMTPQTLARFEARFGRVVAVMHSGLGDAARREQWLRLARGEARVCVGPRSAVFAPLRDLGVIVVDEEHESSYKHEGDPRYDARAVAEQRARVHGAVLVAGSATPRPESVHRLARLRLPRRIDGGALPAVEILDMRGAHNPLHPRTRLALADVARERRKAIVLLNRRGWSNFLSCQACGHVWMCPNCEVALVLHRAGAAIACHHCGHRERVPQRCPECGSVSVSRHGAGTERLEHELAAAFAAGDFPVLRLDADSAGIEARARTLERFMSAPAGVLVGTQMVAKGHDFPRVALGVVIDANATLRFPDFRAEERTFALVTQLAGRAGRGGDRGGDPGATAGRVLVQTRAPQARSILLAARHDSDAFVEGELERRRALAYPPFSTLIRVVCAADEPAAAGAAAAALRAGIDPPGATVLGPAPLFALRGRARAQLVVKARARRAAIAAVGAAVELLGHERAHRGVAISVDVDPQ
jgi:primosomal protein N' (replication factor Y) (superfamily II helicase)